MYNKEKNENPVSLKILGNSESKNSRLKSSLVLQLDTTGTLLQNDPDNRSSLKVKPHPLQRTVSAPAFWPCEFQLRSRS